jgi:hypothetical protein
VRDETVCAECKLYCVDGIVLTAVERRLGVSFCPES